MTQSTLKDAGAVNLGSLSVSYSASAVDPVDPNGSTATPIQQLLETALTAHAGDSGGTYGKNSISVSNIPYSSYSVYLYVSNWSGDPILTDNLQMNQNANGYTAGSAVQFMTFPDGTQTSYTTGQAGQVNGSTQVTDLLFSGMSAGSLQLQWYPWAIPSTLTAIQIVNTGNALPSTSTVEPGGQQHARPQWPEPAIRLAGRFYDQRRQYYQQ